jgi:hypothetical protein
MLPSLGRIEGALMLAGLGLGLGAVVYLLVKGPAGLVVEAGKSAGETLSAAGDAANSVLHGAVIGIGKTVGIPATAAGKCCEAIRAGSVFDASLNCPAGDFTAWMARGERPKGCSGGASGSW